MHCFALFLHLSLIFAGVPSTLNYIPLNEHTPKTPALIPYPNWQINEFGNCDIGLTNVYRIKADSCNRLWVLDTGTFGIGNTSTNVCPYTLNVFDLHTGKFLRRYPLPPDNLTPSTFIANIAIDEGPTCETAFAYMSDELGYGLIAYSWELNKSWRYVLDSMDYGIFQKSLIELHQFRYGLSRWCSLLFQTKNFYKLYNVILSSSTYKIYC